MSDSEKELRGLLQSITGRDMIFGHEPDRDALRERIAELEATVRVLRENEEKLHTSHADTVNRMARLGGQKAALLGVIEDAVENLEDAENDNGWSRIGEITADLKDALRRYGA